MLKRFMPVMLGIAVTLCCYSGLAVDYVRHWYPGTMCHPDGNPGSAGQSDIKYERTFAANENNSYHLEVHCPIPIMRTLRWNDTTKTFDEDEDIDIYVIDNNDDASGDVNFNCTIYATDGDDVNSNGYFEWSSDSLGSTSGSGRDVLGVFFDSSYDHFMTLFCEIPADDFDDPPGSYSDSYIAGYTLIMDQ